jgi:hypothetical protein
MVMRNFSKHSRQYPTLSQEIIKIDGLASTSDQFWRAWKDAVLDLACDASDQNQLLTLIKRAVSSLCDTLEGPRAVSILADLARIVPSSLELIMKHFEASFPYWKNSQSGLQLKFFTQNSLNLGLEVPQILEKIIDFLTKKILLIDLSIRSEDVPFLFPKNLEIPENNLNVLVDAANSENLSGNLKGLGEKYFEEEKAREQEEAQLARKNHLEQIRDYAMKIDSMLISIFEFIQKAKLKGKSHEIGLFILISFEKNVILAAKPKFTQFLIFYAAGIDNFVADRLLGSLLAGFFACDSQLSTNGKNGNMNVTNSQAKAKSIFSYSAFMTSFVMKSNSLTEAQLKVVIDLLLEWIGRKIEALAIFSKSQLEISILASVFETIFRIYITHPNLFVEDYRFKKAAELVIDVLPSSIKSHELFIRSFSIPNSDSCVASEISAIKPSYMPFESLPLPESHQFLLNSGLLRE